MDDPALYGRRRRSPLAPLLAVLIAFLGGIALTAFAVHRSARIAQTLHPVATPAPVRIAVPVPTPMLQPMPPASATQEELSGRLATIESRIDAIDARAAAATGDADRADGLLVTFAARRQLDRGAPLGFLEGMLRERFGGTDAPAVAMVIAAAQRPATLAQLQDGLAALAPTLATARPDAGWWTAAKAELSHLFVIHRADAPASVPADRIAHATRALEQGQVEAAAAEVSRLPGSARAADWLASARRYGLARQALDRLETSALLRPRPAATPPSTAD